jgi:hypothetical protein
LDRPSLPATSGSSGDDLCPRLTTWEINAALIGARIEELDRRLEEKQEADGRGR